MLSESGVLFLSEFTPLGRRWVRPLRLPERRPLELLLNGVLIASLIACRQGSWVHRAIYWHQVIAADGG